jgi:hypothetical protein
VARLNRDALVAQLEAQGLHVRMVTVQTEGEYLPTDADWNNKDVPHLNQVHQWVDNVTFVTDRDLQAQVNLQQVLGIPFPVVLVHYDNAPNEQTHVVTLLAWTIVTHHEFIPVTATRTRAVTSYSVGSTRFWMLFFPAVRWAIRRNWRQLMSEDVPMRERRGRLRALGYRFRGDDDEIRDFRASLPIASDNVIPPEDGPAPEPLGSVRVDALTGSSWTLLGQTDHLGLKLRREGDEVVAYPRMCPHEGADLDTTPATDGCLVCPWHGRRLHPVARLDLADDGSTADTRWHRLAIRDGELHVTYGPP